MGQTILIIVPHIKKINLSFRKREFDEMSLFSIIAKIGINSIIHTVRYSGSPSAGPARETASRCGDGSHG
jgi:hypothetical protein